MYLNKKERSAIHAAMSHIGAMIEGMNPTNENGADSIANLEETQDGLLSIINKSKNDYDNARIRKMAKKLAANATHHPAGGDAEPNKTRPSGLGA